MDKDSKAMLEVCTKTLETLNATLEVMKQMMQRLQYSYYYPSNSFKSSGYGCAGCGQWIYGLNHVCPVFSSAIGTINQAEQNK